MIDYENYKNNIVTVEKAGISDVNVNKSVLYTGSLDFVNKNNESKEKRSTTIPPLGAAVVGLDNTAAPLPINQDFYNAWTDIDAQELFVNTKPTCYLILSKPGAGAYTLGEAISKKLHCFHICPRNILSEEIEQMSSTGKCLDFNMRHNKVCTFDIFFKMLKVKLESEAVKHRGYIISGLPLVTCSKSPKYLVNNLYGEEAILDVNNILFDTICNLNKKKPKKILRSNKSQNSSTSNVADIEEDLEEVVVEEEEAEAEHIEEEQEIKVELPKFALDSCSDIVFPKKPYYKTKKSILLHQLNELFNLKMKPDIVIYLSCTDKDLVTKKLHKYINYKTNRNTVEPFVANITNEIRWPLKYDSYDFTNPLDSHVFNPKYNCRQPMNFEQRSVEQMCNYRQDLLPTIENIIKDINPKNVIKLDARLSIHEIMHNLMERLMMLHIMPVIVPEPLYMEEPPEEMEEFWKAIEERDVIKDGVLTFKRIPSAWYSRCPVELKKRQSVIGNPKLGVIFSKYVYLLASLDNLINFWKNPRPYLQIKYLEPTCRIAVLGTKYSGKTMISECLSWLFDTPIIDYKSFVVSEKEKKYNNYAKTILSEIIATIEDARFAVWKSLEMDRFAQIEAWCKSKIVLMKKYVPLLLEVNKFEKLKSPSGDEMLSEEILQSYNTLRNILQIDFQPILDDVDKCKNALEHDVMAKYAPENIRTPITKPSIPVLGDADVMEAIAQYIIANDLQAEIEPTVEELMNELIKTIGVIDQKSQNDSNFDSMFGKYIIDGLPSDPEYWGFLSDRKCIPDYTIALIENRELEPELLDYYKSLDNVVKIHHARYKLADDPLLKIKLKTKKIPDHKNLDMKIIVDDVIKTTFSLTENDNVDKPETSSWETFTEDIEKIKDDWEAVKGKIDQHHKYFIDVELENKTDVQVVEEVLLRIRTGYFLPCEVVEGEEGEDEENEIPKDIMTYNNPHGFGETDKYCPISFYDHGILWEGKPEYCVKFDNKLHYFTKELFPELFQKDVTKYQAYNKPYKSLPPLRICVIGCVGSGKTTVSKMLAKELGLLYIDFSEVFNDYLLPKQYKKVGRKYENPFTDLPEEEGAPEFQMDEENENLLSDIIANETELRRMINNYFENGTPLFPPLMQRVIGRLWFQEPFLKTGFVLDGYPKLPADVEDMTANYNIPDLIIELEGSPETTVQRLSPILFKTWKLQLGEAKEKARQKIEIEKKVWLNSLTKDIVIKLTLEDILERIFFSEMEPVQGLSNESIMMDADPAGTMMDPKIFNLYKELIQELPEPVDTSEWEKPTEVRERINERLESLFETEDENIQSLKDLVSEHKIKVVSVNGNKPLIKVIRLALSKVSSLRNRNQSLLEQTYIIDPEIAEMLISEGYYFLSKFKRICPVFLFEIPHAIQNIYKISKHRSQVFTVIHRSYVYFICGEKSVKKFRTNPLKYVTCDNIRQFIEYPLRIGVIGAPKSGKSLLSAKLAKRYRLICLSKGIAVRDVLVNKHWTELGIKLTSAISSGECISTDLVTKAIQNMMMDYRATTNGFVLDGCPETASEAIELVKIGLYPNIIFDISTSVVSAAQRSQKEMYYDILKWHPPYSRPFIVNRYQMWQNKCCNVREWIEGDYQNTYILDGNKSRWQCWQNAINVINNFVPEVHRYLTNVHTEAVPAHVMCISNEIFEKRMSNFKNMCPLCLYKNELRNNAYPVDKKGVIQYRNKFYWVCSEHIETVLQAPHIYLSTQKIDIPELPAIVKTINMSLVYANGICIVTYAEHLPAQKILQGTNKFAASFKGKTYMFCSYECLVKFLAKPHMYFDIKVFKDTAFRPLSLKTLPNLGYLEQTLATALTEACCSVNVHRPKYPGLSFQVSGLLHIALYLKTHNPRMDKAVTELYDRASKVYDARCRLLMDVALFLRSMENPFASYAKCCAGSLQICDSKSIQSSVLSETSTTRQSMTKSEANTEQ